LVSIKTIFCKNITIEPNRILDKFTLIDGFCAQRLQLTLAVFLPSSVCLQYDYPYDESMAALFSQKMRSAYSLQIHI
jgi:hypothetical protein